MIGLGKVLTLSAGRRVVLSRLIGEGSQGVVYEATPLSRGDRLAVKWYFPVSGTASQRAVIADLVERGAPSDRFLWPSELVEAPGEPGFGYVMPLRPERYAGLVELLTGKADVTFSIVCRLCLELTHSFLILHSQGLCYRDISFSNVFFDERTGVPLICDNDNVGIDGRSNSAVLGTRRFMAPEIVRRESAPSTQTDLYSLAVLLFYVLMMGHPLVGRRELQFECWDDQAESMLFGREPLFVFDPLDRSNEPVPDLHGAVLSYWNLYPPFLRKLFVQAFTDGLRDPLNGRVRESVWRSAIARLQATIVPCATCGKENFADPGGAATPCWFCERDVRATSWLTVENRSLALARGTVVHGHVLRHDYDFDTLIGEVVPHPTRADLLGLRNLTDQAWTVRLPSEERIVEPGKSIRLSIGTIIDFGTATGTVRERLG